MSGSGDYISREAAIAAVDNYSHVYFPRNKRKLEEIPAADVRPVVLCKDCYWADYSGMGNGTVWCMEMERAMHETDFCSRGKMEES